MSHKEEICRKCPAYMAPGPVTSKLRPDCRLIIVGEAPGEQEIREGEPFVGPAGGLLWMMARKVGLSRNDTSLINSARCITKDPAAFKYCWENFGKHDLASLPETTPVLLLGNEAKNVVTPGNSGTGILVMRGAKFGRFTYALHPSYIRRTARHESANTPEGQGGEKQDLAPTLAYDIQAALNKGIEVTKSYHHQINRIPGGDKHVSSDIETAMTLDPRLGPPTQIGFGYGNGQVIREMYTEAHRNLYQQIFDTRKVVWHNGGAFDIPYLRFYKYDIPDWEDTLIAAHLLHPDFPLSLEFQNSLYAHYLPWKSTKRRDPYTYHATDLDVGWILWDEMEHELKSQGLWSLYVNEDKAIAAALIPMREKGIKVDVELMQKMFVAWSMKIKQVEETLHKIAPVVDWNSPQQVGVFLYDVLRLREKFNKDKYGGLRRTTDQDALEELYVETKHPVLKLLLGYRGLTKQRDTYLRYDTDENGYFHYDMTFTTATGRARGFLLTVPRGIMRQVFIPDEPGWEIAAADLNRVELWISAVRSGDKKFQEILASTNFHAYVGTQCYGFDVKKGMEEYEQSKHITHGYNFGRSDRSISRDHGIDLWKVQKVLRWIDYTFPRWHEWREEQLSRAQTQGYLENAFGFKRYFWGGNLKGMVFSFEPQSNVAHMIKRIVIQLQYALPKPARIVFPFHDAVIFTYPPELREQCHRIVQEAMTQPWEQLGGWAAGSDIKFGANLQEAT
jgi:uracil-DNA glycosylase family 4